MLRDLNVKELFIVSTLLIAPPWLDGVHSAIECDIRLTHGVASGDVTSRGAVIWARASEPGDMVVDIDTDSAFPSARRFRSRNSRRTDFTAQVKLEELLPATRYHFRVHFVSASGKRSSSVNGTLKTAPDTTVELQALRFVVGGDLGGHGYCREREQGYKVLDAVNQLSPDFFVANGDMIYADTECPAEGPEGRRNIPGDFSRIDSPAIDWTNQAQVQEVYWRHWRYHRADPIFQRFLAATPVYVQWDDHEVINDFGARWPLWPPDQDREGFVNVVEAGRNAWFHYNPIAQASNEPERIYRSFRWGKDLELFLIDGRSYRDRNDRPDLAAHPKSLLGKEQLAWLKQGLAASDATWKIVSSDVPLSAPTGTDAETYGRDGWANGTEQNFSSRTGFEHELLNLLGYLDASDVENLVFVVTDVHVAISIRYDVDADRDGDRLVFHEFISGPLIAGKLPAPPGLDPTLRPVILYAEGDLFNFGYYRLERHPDGTVHFLADIRDETGAVRPGSSIDLAPEGQ